jgi:hypothetical protein
VSYLAEEPARTLLATVTSGPLDESVRARIIEETHGNPLALLELYGGLGAAELASGFALPDTGDLPRRIENQYVARLAELPDEAQRLVLLAAADPVGDSTLIFRAAGMLGLDRSVMNLAVEAGLLTSVRTYGSVTLWCALPFTGAPLPRIGEPHWQR